MVSETPSQRCVLIDIFSPEATPGEVQEHFDQCEEQQ